MKAQYTAMVALGALMMAGLTGCNEDNKADAAAQQPMPPLPVKVMKLQKRDVEIRETWFGHLRGVEQADIRPEISGRIIRQVYTDGALCQEGDVLFEIDPEPYQAAVRQCEAALEAANAAKEQAQVAHETAQQDLERYSNLVKKGSISQEAFEHAQQQERASAAAEKLAEAQVKQAEAALEEANINLKRCTVRAPFTGLASKANVSPGDFVAAGSVVLTTMSSVNPIRVDFVVPGKHMLNKIKPQNYDANATFVSPIDNFQVILEDGSVFTDDQGRPITGTVVAVDSSVNSSTGTVNFIGHLPNPQLKLRAGSAVRVDARVGVEEGAFLVPARALVSAMNHRYIFVVAPNGEPCPLDVQAGREVVMEMPNGDGTSVPMLMQIVTGTVAPIEVMLQQYGITNPEEAQVIVEGGLQAAMIAKKNGMARAAGATEGFATVAPQPFFYTTPMTTTPSVTAKPQAPAQAPAAEAAAEGDNANKD